MTKRSSERLRSHLPTIWPLMRPERRRLALLVLTAIPVGFLQAGLVALVAQTGVAMADGADRVAVGAASLSFELAISDAVLVGFGLALLLMVLNVATSYFPARIVSNVQARMRRAVFQDFVHASWSLQAQERDGHLQEVMTSQVNRTALLLMALGRGIPETLVLLGLLASAFLLSPLAAAAMLVVGGLLFAIFRPTVARMRRHSQLHALASESFAAAVNESVQLGEEYHVFGVEDAQAAVVSERVDEVHHPYFRSKFMVEMVGGLYANAVLLLLMFGLAGLQWLNVSDIGAVGAVVLILLRAMGSAKGLQSVYTQVHNHLPYLERATRSWQAYRDRRAPSGSRPLTSIERFELRDVAYRYTDTEVALKDVDLEVPAGRAVGIVGPSGAGKSTLVQILLGLRHPTGGAFLVNGVQAAEHRREDWTRLVGFVPQQPKIHLGTIADNIRFHRTGITDEQVVTAARRAHLHDEIMAFPEGYERMIGQGAAALSGGQRQRLCLARALLTEPQVLILDEPTSALDPLSERYVQASLADLKTRGATLFIIAHRSTTLEFIDQLVVLDDGRIVADGPPAEVVSSSEFVRSALSELEIPALDPSGDRSP